MSKLSLKPLSSNKHFDIGQDQCGRWVARDRNGIKGGTFFTCEEAMRFARAEARAQAHIHLSAAGEGNGRWRASAPSNEGRVS